MSFSLTRLGVLAVALLALLLPGHALAAPVTYTAPSGAEITLDPGAVVPGGRIAISGAGFTGSGGAGSPLVAVKPDDQDLLWTYGGTSAYPAQGTADAPIWFEVANDGTFSGWIDVPANLSKTGPGIGANAGRHWLRVLAGAFGTANDNKVAIPASVQAYYDVVDRVTLGATSVSGTFYPGTTFQAGLTSAVTPKGLGFTPSTAVDVTLDGATLAGASITTDADGAFPSSSRVTIPGGTTPGAHTLAFATGAVTASVAITVTAAPTATLETPSVRPGGTAAVTLDGFLGVDGSGQKVALKIEPNPVSACLEADVNGDGTITTPVPSGLAPGNYTMRVLAGASCVEGGTQNDLPGRMVPLTLNVSDTAPTQTAPALGGQGEAIALSGAGFTPGDAATAYLDGVAAGTQTVKDAGQVVITVSLKDAAPGTHVLRLRTASAGTASTITIASAPAGTITTTKVVPGGTLTVDVSGFRKGDGSGGQKVGIKIDSGDVLGCVTTDADGKGTGTITVPASTTLGDHSVRLLAGTACVSGAAVSEAPARSVQVSFTVLAPDPTPTDPKPTDPKPAPPVTPGGTTTTAKPTAATVKKAQVKSGKLVLTLSGGTAKKVKVSVTTSVKVKLTRKGKAKVVTLATATVTRAGTVKLTLTKDGKALLKLHKKIKVKVKVTPSTGGGKAITTTLTLTKA
ncbi:hypothetical protein [Baekduia sp. Peel2402]|uniref:hypothetical protein n=1 Tax=Baekduia sp. Peel2402 TaxID=3458296 RepID=UPI00403EE714